LDSDSAHSGDVQSGNQAEQGGLAAARRAMKQNIFAIANRQGEVGQHRPCAEELLDLFDFEQSRHLNIQVLRCEPERNERMVSKTKPEAM